jgi:hypothetical protein
MTAVREEGELGAGIDEVWKVVGDFPGFVEAMGIPVEVSGTGVGATRTIALGPSPTVERLEALDNDAKRLVYSMVEGPLPVQNYVATMQLSALDGGRTRLEWSSTFEPGSMAEGDAIQAVSGIYKGGIAGLQARFGA